MSEESIYDWLHMSRVARQGYSNVPGPPMTGNIPASESSRDWAPQEPEVPRRISNRRVVVNDNDSETDTAWSWVENAAVSEEETESSDTEVEVALIPGVENFGNYWEEGRETEEGPTLNLNSVIIIERESDIVQEPSVVSVPENPNAGVENPIIRLENPDYEPEEVTDGEASRGSSKRSYGVMMSEDDDGQTCPVCLDVWTNAGVHRLSSLECGHLFGKSCISRWLSLEKKKHCPQCNKKASPNDIRELYATKLVAVDATEKNRLEKELEEVRQQKRQLENELLKNSMNLESCMQQLDLLKAHVAALKGDSNNERKGPNQTQKLSCPDRVIKFYLEKTFGIPEGSCRVSAFSPLNNVLIVSHQIRNHLFRGYGVKKISKNGDVYQGHAVMLHQKVLRDMCFHPVTPNLILTVSFDKSAKVTNIEDNRTVKVFHTEQPLWSCCWDHDDPNVFYTGSGNGTVSVYDLRSHSEPVTNLPAAEDVGAVVALRYAPAGQFSRGAIICCRLNSIVYYEKISATEFNPTPVPGLLGPFFSLSYNSDTQHLLVSCRPSVGNPTVRHIYCEMNGTSVNKLFVFQGGTRQTLLCRSCFIPAGNESLCAVFQENTNSIELWSTTKFSRFQSIPVNEYILDLISIRTENRNFLGAVSDSVVRLFEGPT